MDRSKAQLLELTRCGLWGAEPDVALFEGGVDWMELLVLAKMQTILGVVSSAIERLPLHLRPERELGLRLHQRVSLGKRRRASQVDALDKLLRLLRRAGVERPVLLKGLGVGMNYLDPQVRQYGDIDIYVGIKHYYRVWDFICKELNITKQRDLTDHHFDFKFLNINIEIHKYANAPGSVAFSRTEFMEWCTSQLEGDKLREVSIDGVEVLLPPLDFDFIYIFYHSWRHFLTGGVGLRQICDWSCFIDKFSAEFNREELERLISLFKLQKPIALFATMAVKGLGLDSEKYPNYKSLSDQLYLDALDKVWCRGNFGHYNDDFNERRDRGLIVRKTLGIVAMLKDMIFLLRVDAHYAIKFYSLFTVEHIKLALKGV